MDLSTAIAAGTSAITLGKSLWDTYSDQIPDWLTDKAKEKGLEHAKEKWQEFKFTQAEKEYKTRLAQNYGTARLLGSAGDSDPVPLEGIFTDVIVLKKPLAYRRFNLEALRESDAKLYGHDVERQNGIELVKEKGSKRLFILGKPGAGKTTFLKYITLQAVKGDFPKTPIFVSLHEWSKATKTENGNKVELSLISFIAQQFDICSFPDAEKFIEFLLGKGDAIILLDGLDEVNSIHNNRIITEVKNFCTKYNKAQCLITCRIAATEYSFDHFTYMEVADFNDDQIQNFVKKWFKNNPVKCEKFLTDFKKPEHRGVQELARSPLLLGMLCLGFSDSMEFSSRRIDIYEDAIDALLRKWDKRRNIERDALYKGLSHNLKKSLFTRIAYETFERNQYLIEEKILVNRLDDVLERLPNPEGQDFDGKLFLKSIEAQHGIFVERAQKYYSFVHLTFQEYFTACAIKGSEVYQQMLMKNINDPRWREVFLLTASTLDDAGDFFSIFKESIDYLIAKDEKILAFFAWIKNKADDIQNPSPKKDIYFFYIILEFVIARALTRDPALDHALALALDRTLDLNLDIDLEHTHNLRLALNSNLDHALNLDLDLARVHALDRALAIAITFNSKNITYDYELYFLKIIHLKAEGNLIKTIKKSNINNFIEKTSLTPRTKATLKTNVTTNNWSQFQLELIKAAQKRDIAQEWNFSPDQIKRIINYLEANQLCRDCLKLATISASERRAVNDGLFFTAKPSN